MRSNVSRRAQPLRMRTGLPAYGKILQQFASLIDVLFERFRRLIAVLQPPSQCSAKLPLRAW
jgi:hypothetical protein